MSDVEFFEEQGEGHSDGNVKKEIRSSNQRSVPKKESYILPALGVVCALAILYSAFTILSSYWSLEDSKNPIEISREEEENKIIIR